VPFIPRLKSLGFSIQNFTREEADRMRGVDLDCATRDLYEAIARGEYPS
jgi:catalase